MERWRVEEDRSAYGPIRRGWFLRDKEARQEFLRRHVPSQGRNGTGAIWNDTAEAAAEDFVRRKMAAQKWSEERLKEQSKGHPWKVELAKRLRTETTMTLTWIARRLQMGSASTPKLS